MAEQLMIQTYQPVWNGLIDGFGNDAPDGGRGKHVHSRWDTLHPGRYWAYQLPDPPYAVHELRLQILAHFDEHPPKLAPTVPPILYAAMIEATGEEDDDLQLFFPEE